MNLKTAMMGKAQPRPAGLASVPFARPVVLEEWIATAKPGAEGFTEELCRWQLVGLRAFLSIPLRGFGTALRAGSCGSQEYPSN